MSKCCDSKIPESTATRFIFRPNGRRFINGLSDSYEIIYYKELEPYIGQIEFRHYLERVIDGFNVMWPCDFCFYCGYTCALCTLGLSFLFPNCCISDAYESFIDDINEINDQKLHKLKLHLSIQRRCCTSWLQLDIIDNDNENGSNPGNNDEKLVPVINEE